MRLIRRRHHARGAARTAARACLTAIPAGWPRPAALRALLLAIALLHAAASSAEAVRSQPTADGGLYRGEVVDGRFQGEGSIEWENGARYEGSFEDGLMSGRGRLRMADGSIYEGSFRMGAPNGEGKLSRPDGTVHEGWFRSGLPHGQGRSRGPDGRYEGAFRDGRFSGRGELVLPGGQRYRGEFMAGRMHGSGRYESADRESYEGRFVMDQFTGKGVHTRPDGARHEGEFLRWLPQGPGRFVDAQGNLYEGHFERGVLSGKGRSVRKDEGSYEGEIRNWLAHGQGRLRMDNGDTYEGSFVDGAFDGPGTLRYARPRDGRSELSGLWRDGELVDSPDLGNALATLEAALYTERERLARALEALAPQDPAKVDMYLLAFAGDGTQEVFRRESEFVRAQFDRDYGTTGRSIVLANSRSMLGALPMATLTSLREALQTIAARMDTAQDILFLYLTSHGAPQHELSLTQQAFDLPDLDADTLARLLRESGIRWRVVVVSACFSGGFIDALRDPGTLVITAARHDRRSFGCADENDFTYFGRAYFKDALPASRSFQEAFRRSREIIRQRELELFERTGSFTERDYSLPQISAPRAISNQLEKWWESRPTLARN